MPVTWTISRPIRLVIAVCKGTVTRLDIEAYLDTVVVDGALPYAKIFDMTGAEVELSDHDMMLLGARIQAYARNGGHPMGPLAIVAATPESRDRALLFTALGQAQRPIKVFGELHAARKWLDAQPKPGA